MPIPGLNLPKFVYGTTRLGDEKISFEQRVELALEAIAATGFVHASDQYGEALTVLKEAFGRCAPNLPRQIFKTGWDSVAQIRSQILSQTEAVGIKKMTVAQLCLGGELAEQVRVGDPAARDLLNLQKEELADHFLMEVFPWTSQSPFEALKSGFTEGLIDGFIFYFNPLQCFASNELWELIVEKKFPVVAMRTVCGGEVNELANRDSYVAERARLVKPLYRQSGCRTWTEFCVRFVYSFEFIQTTVGATGKSENLREFVACTSENIEPLPPEIVSEILTLHRKWSDEVDRHAAPWSM